MSLFELDPSGINKASGVSIFNYENLSSNFSSAIYSISSETFQFFPYIHYYPLNIDDAPVNKDDGISGDFSLKIPYTSSYDENKLYNPYP